ncbi:NAD(P)/FAD-dependent oxidoreductase [Pedobacter sp. SYSU D00535]|uniref:phytoene desaturase family protein n=1 Tax=Pedobacter sp. SYSU D00535 TaxID=2810308 RepID=UPI001A9566EE|nr:phytoene desaturase family protein [Pedobacter sp. SYSU D00535]
MSKSKIAVIGAGFAGLTTAALLAKEGHSVTIFEKNDQPGGRARIWEQDGFRFDMGPSWYWMPEVFENYFKLFNKTTADFYQLIRLSPSYRVYWGRDYYTDVPAELEALKALFEEIEPGASAKLEQFLEQAKYKYDKGMNDYVYRPSHSITEYLDPKLLVESFKIQMFTTIRSHIRKYFKNEKLIKILEFPVLFLGGTAQNTPALYSLMNYADLVLGTWYPVNGMNEIVKAMVAVAQSQGVTILLNQEVKEILIEGDKARSIVTQHGAFPTDFIISNADYQHTDQKLLPKDARNYSPEYWEKRTMSPSSLLFYIGTNKKIPSIKHHNLFFHESLDNHADTIYGNPRWPEKPLFYVSCTSKTDNTVAPEGGENLFFLIPLAPGLQDDANLREKYFELLMEKFSEITGEDIRDAIVVKRSYALDDFIKDYHSFKGNAYGLANTLLQTAFLKPKMRSSKIKNLLFTGQLTIPGPGVPPAIISGQVAAREALKTLSNF